MSPLSTQPPSHGRGRSREPVYILLILDAGRHRWVRVPQVVVPPIPDEQASGGPLMEVVLEVVDDRGEPPPRHPRTRAADDPSRCSGEGSDLEVMNALGRSLVRRMPLWTMATCLVVALVLEHLIDRLVLH